MAARPSRLDEASLLRLRALSKSRPGLLAKLAQLYVENAPEHLARIERGLLEGAPDMAREAAHTLKSSSANVGALHAAALCKEIEEEAAQGKLEGVRARIETLDLELAAVFSELREFS